MKAQLANLKLNSNQDVFLYGGYESTRFTQNTIAVDGETNFSFLGLQADLRFGDASYKNEKKRIEAQLEVKEHELARSKLMEIKKSNILLENLRKLKRSYLDLKSVSTKTDALEKRSSKNFYAGKTKYFEFLSSRNQVFGFRRSAVETKANFWKVYLDYLYVNGNVDKLCQNGGGL